MDDLVPYEIRKDALSYSLALEKNNVFDRMRELEDIQKKVQNAEHSLRNVTDSFNDLRQQYFDLTGEDWEETW